MDDENDSLHRNRRFADLCLYGFVRALVAVIQVLPFDMADRFCGVMATLLTRFTSIRRKTLTENFDKIFPDSTKAQRAALTWAMWHHLLLMICEIAWAPRRLHLTNWTKHFRLRDNRVILRHLLSGRPTIMVTGHYGNFEICGYVVGLMGFPTVTIARRLDNGFLHDFLADFRGTHGQFMVDKDGCAPLIDRHLQSGGLVSLLADQHAGDRGCWVDFLGCEASCHKALALFSLTSNAPMVVGYTRRIGRPMQFESGCQSAADPQNDVDGVCGGVRPLTQWYSDQLGATIAPAIEQYWWLHRRWRVKPSKAKAAPPANAITNAA